MPAPDAAAATRLRAIIAGEGFPFVRVAAAEALLPAREAALAARAEGRLAELSWMTEAWLTRATDPEAFLAGARSVVLVGLPYRPASITADAGSAARGRVAAYAQARDYHRVFETKLRRAVRRIREELGAAARATVDYGPLLERPFAARAGLGWLGKSTMLLAPGAGPWLLLGAIATNLSLEPDAPLRKSCGSCTRCITACPTGAIAPDGYTLDARLCISYHTIENRGPIPRELRAKFGAWIFGCDDCLTSCPVGRPGPAPYPDLAAHHIELAAPALVPLLTLDEAGFAERFRGRAIMRAKRDGLLRNVCIALGNTGAADAERALASALHDTSPLVRGHAAWGLARLVTRLHLDDSPARSSLERRLALEQDPWVREELELARAALTAPAPLG